jgi:8-hydroxy-5-deazaflavin:NADPH oxidoreductase
VSVVGFIGGTGPLGRGLGLRLALAGHDVILGSRTTEKGQAAAADCGAPMRGGDNATACAQADILFVTVPFEGQVDLLPPLAETLAGKVVVSTVVPMGFDAKGPHPLEVAEGSAAEQCARLLPGARIVSGFQSVPAPKLLKPDLTVEMDVPLLSDDEDAAEQVAALAGDVKALHGFVAGPLRLSATVEALTPLIISINKRYKAHAGIRFAGLPR